MPVYKIDKEKLNPLKESGFSLEKHIQKLTEDNVETIFGLEFVTTEFQLNNLRIDTLGFDKENNSFVIIEYKRDKSFSVIDQGYAYLALMLNNKADFILEYNEKSGKNLKRDDVDWSQSRVIFVADSFTNYQRNAINFKDLPIELWEAKKYEQDLVLFSQLKPIETNESINTISKGFEAETVAKEIKKYTIDDHFKEGWDKSRELFDLLNLQILDLNSEMQENPTKHYIGYKIGNSNLVGIKIRKSKLVLELLRVRPEDLNDPQNAVFYVENSMKNWNKHVSVFDINTEEDITYAMFLIKQVYNKFFK